MATDTSGTLTINHHTVAYRHVHRPEAPTLIAFHGWLDNLCSFDPLIALCPEFSWLSVDLPGHGLSTHPPEGSHPHWVDYMDTLYALFSYLGPGPHHLVGHSLGAGLISIYAGMFPEHIASLTLIDLVGSLIAEPEHAPLRLRESVLSFARLDKARIPSYPSLSAAIKARQAATPLDTPLLAPMVRRNLVENPDGTWQWRTDQRLLCPPAVGLSEEQTRFFLKNIQAPVLMITPEKGLVVNNPIFADRLKHLKRLTHHKIPGGHHAHLEHPEHVAALLREFFA